MSRFPTSRFWIRKGWHTFRHTCSTMLRSLGVDVKVQQELLPHVDIQTTMDIYTQAVSDAKREANSTVVRMVVPAAEQAKGPLLAALAYSDDCYGRCRRGQYRPFLLPPRRKLAAASVRWTAKGSDAACFFRNRFQILNDCPPLLFGQQWADDAIAQRRILEGMSGV
jgi:hypothetical protein